MACNRSYARFSLIELLVVVAVILIIAAIAIPNYMKSKMLANESSAVLSLRNITTTELVYSTTYEIDFSATLLKLSGTGLTPIRVIPGRSTKFLRAGSSQDI
jgi:type IV pilus assembly protein PilA